MKQFKDWFLNFGKNFNLFKSRSTRWEKITYNNISYWREVKK